MRDRAGEHENRHERVVAQGEPPPPSATTRRAEVLGDAKVIEWLCQVPPELLLAEAG